MKSAICQSFLVAKTASASPAVPFSSLAESDFGEENTRERRKQKKREWQDAGEEKANENFHNKTKQTQSIDFVWKESSYIKRK